MPAKDTALRGDLNAAIPLPAESVDVVTAFAVLEHLHRPEIFVAEIFRVLKPGSRCILTTPSPRSQTVLEFRAYRLKLISENDVRDHNRYFGANEVRALFRAFAEVSVESFQFGLNTLFAGHKQDSEGGIDDEVYRATSHGGNLLQVCRRKAGMMCLFSAF